MQTHWVILSISIFTYATCSFTKMICCFLNVKFCFLANCPITMHLVMTHICLNFLPFAHHPFRFLLKDVLTYGQEEIRIKSPTLQFVDLLHHLTYNSCAAQVSFLPPPSHLAPSFVLPFLQPFNIIYLVHLDLKGFCCCGHCPEVWGCRWPKWPVDPACTRAGGGGRRGRDGLFGGTVRRRWWRGVQG